MADVRYKLAQTTDLANYQIGVMSDLTLEFYKPNVDNFVILGSQSESGVSEYGFNTLTESLPSGTYFTFTETCDEVYAIWGALNDNSYGTYPLTMAVYDNGTHTKVATKTLTIVIKTKFYANFNYDLNGGSGTVPTGYTATQDSVKEKPVKTINVTDIVPTLKGYTFEGWSKTKYPKGTGTAEYEAGNAYTVKWKEGDYPTDDILYAVWSGSPATTNISVKHNGEWKDGTAYVKRSGAWKEADTVYAKQDGEWRS